MAREKTSQAFRELLAEKYKSSTVQRRHKRQFERAVNNAKAHTRKSVVSEQSGEEKTCTEERSGGSNIDNKDAGALIGERHYNNLTLPVAFQTMKPPPRSNIPVHDSKEYNVGASAPLSEPIKRRKLEHFLTFASLPDIPISALLQDGNAIKLDPITQRRVCERYKKKCESLTKFEPWGAPYVKSFRSVK